MEAVGAAVPQTSVTIDKLLLYRHTKFQLRAANSRETVPPPYGQSRTPNHADRGENGTQMGSKGRAGALQLPIDLPGSCERQRGALGAAIWVLRAYFPLNARSGTPNEILNPKQKYPCIITTCGGEHSLGRSTDSKYVVFVT